MSRSSRWQLGPAPSSNRPQPHADGRRRTAGVTAGAGARPPGWDYDPSAWEQRIPIVVVALVGFAAAGWLALYQHGVTDTVWEPFFGDGTREIVRESGFSRYFERFPIGDAALGALGYLADAVTGVIGGQGRWRRMPWIVVVFGAFVGPFGAISVMLVIFQPVLYGAFCTLCLVSAAASLVMIGPALDEVLASLQHVRRVQDRGGSAWRAFWGLAPVASGEELR